MEIMAEKAVRVGMNHKKASDKKAETETFSLFLIKKKIIFYIFLKKRKKIVDKYKTF